MAVERLPGKKLATDISNRSAVKPSVLAGPADLRLRDPVSVLRAQRLIGNRNTSRLLARPVPRPAMGSADPASATGIRRNDLTVGRLTVEATRWDDVGDAVASTSGASGGVIFAKDRTHGAPGVVVKPLVSPTDNNGERTYKPQNPLKAMTSEALLGKVGVSTPGTRVTSGAEKVTAHAALDTVARNQRAALTPGDSDQKVRLLEQKVTLVENSKNVLVMGEVTGESFADMGGDRKARDGEQQSDAEARFSRFAASWMNPDFQVHFGRIFAVDTMLGHRDRFTPENGLNFGNIMVTADGKLTTIDNDAKLEMIKRGDLTPDHFAMTEYLAPSTLARTVDTLVATLTALLLGQKTVYRQLTAYLSEHHAEDLFSTFAENFTRGAEEARDQVLDLDLTTSGLGVDSYYDGTDDYSHAALQDRKHYLELRSSRKPSTPKDAVKKVRKGR